MSVSFILGIISVIMAGLFLSAFAIKMASVPLVLLILLVIGLMLADVITSARNENGA